MQKKEKKTEIYAIKLPCKIGDIVYVHESVIWMYECGKCENFRIGGFGDPHECSITNSQYKNPECIEIKEAVATLKDILIWMAYGEIGETIFLNKEEAVKKLKEKREKIKK